MNDAQAPWEAHQMNNEEGEPSFRVRQHLRNYS